MALEKAARIAKCTVVPNRPYHVQWLVTRKCNYRCKGCNVWREQDTEELSTEEVIKGLDILKELGVIDLVFSGGAPLLREDIGTILDYASRFFVTTVYDNGSLAAEKVDALRNVDFVAISLDTLNPEKNDHAKGVKDSWYTAMRTINILHEERIPINISPTISQFNLHEIVDLTEFFLEKGIPLWYCLYSYDKSVDSTQLFKIGKKNDEFEIKDREYMVKLCSILAEMKRHDSNILITTKTLEAVKHLYLYGKRLWKCQALQSFFMIDHLGRVAGCHLRKPVATVFDLLHSWNSIRFDDLREAYSKCDQCTYLCYIFYSIHGSVIGNFQIARDRWKNVKLLINRNKLMSPNLAKH